MVIFSKHTVDCMDSIEVFLRFTVQGSWLADGPQKAFGMHRSRRRRIGVIKVRKSASSDRPAPVTLKGVGLGASRSGRCVGVRC